MLTEMVNEPSEFEPLKFHCIGNYYCHFGISVDIGVRVVTVREIYLENEIFSRSGKSQGILWMVREI